VHAQHHRPTISCVPSRISAHLPPVLATALRSSSRWLRMCARVCSKNRIAAERSRPATSLSLSQSSGAPLSPIRLASLSMLSAEDAFLSLRVRPRPATSTGAGSTGQRGDTRTSTLSTYDTDGNEGDRDSVGGDGGVTDSKLDGDDDDGAVATDDRSVASDVAVTVVQAAVDAAADAVVQRSTDTLPDGTGGTGLREGGGGGGGGGRQQRGGRAASPTRASVVPRVATLAAAPTSGKAGARVFTGIPGKRSRPRTSADGPTTASLSSFGSAGAFSGSGSVSGGGFTTTGGGFTAGDDDDFEEGLYGAVSTVFLSPEELTRRFDHLHLLPERGNKYVGRDRILGQSRRLLSVAPVRGAMARPLDASVSLSDGEVWDLTVVEMGHLSLQQVRNDAALCGFSLSCPVRSCPLFVVSLSSLLSSPVPIRPVVGVFNLRASYYLLTSRMVGDDPLPVRSCLVG
jgi:hypothetical protein